MSNAGKTMRMIRATIARQKSDLHAIKAYGRKALDQDRETGRMVDVLIATQEQLLDHMATRFETDYEPETLRAPRVYPTVTYGNASGRERAQAELGLGADGTDEDYP